MDRSPSVKLWIWSAIGITICLGLQVMEPRAAVSSPTSITLTWTAPGDNGFTGRAAVYDIRYSLAIITTTNWVNATKVTGVPVPKTAGSTELFEVTSLALNTAYYFALKVGDEVPNWSAMSNVIRRSTAIDATPPSAITNLATGAVTSSTVALSWTAPGDDGTTGTAKTYDVRYSTAAITAATFALASPVSGEPAPKVAGGAENFTVVGLISGINYYFAIKTADEVPNWSALSNQSSIATCGGVCTGTLGNVDCSPDGMVDIADLSALINYLFLSADPMCICLAEANLDADVSNRVDVADLSRLIDHLFGSRTPFGPCH